MKKSSIAKYAKEIAFLRKNPWDPTNHRFVAFFDILGFKDMITRRSHEEVYDLLDKINHIAKKAEGDEIEDNSLFSQLRLPIHIINFSDSIAVFSNGDTPLEFIVFIRDISNLFRSILKLGVLIKGGVSYGKISVNKPNRVFFGQPIIDAFQLEEDLNYLGISCHFSVDKYISENHKKLNEYLSFSKRVQKVITPLKSGKIVHTNICWALFTKANGNDYDGAIEIVNSLYPLVSGSPGRYIDNTLAILEDMRKNTDDN